MCALCAMHYWCTPRRRMELNAATFGSQIAAERWIATGTLPYFTSPPTVVHNESPERQNQRGKNLSTPQGNTLFCSPALTWIPEPRHWFQTWCSQLFLLTLGVCGKVPHAPWMTLQCIFLLRIWLSFSFSAKGMGQMTSCREYYVNKSQVSSTHLHWCKHITMTKHFFRKLIIHHTSAFHVLRGKQSWLIFSSPKLNPAAKKKISHS